MEESKLKSLLFIFIFLIVIVSTSVFTKSYNIYANKFNNTDNNDTYVDNNQSDISNNNTISNTNDSITKKYISTDNIYSLSLIENNSILENEHNRFLMDIKSKSYISNFTGTYDISNDKIILTIESGCLDENNNFICKLPQNINIENNNKITLDYYDTKIMFGDIELFIER